MIETVPLAKAAEAYGRMMRNEARFRIVLVTGAPTKPHHAHEFQPPVWPLTPTSHHACLTILTGSIILGSMSRYAIYYHLGGSKQHPQRADSFRKVVAHLEGKFPNEKLKFKLDQITYGGHRISTDHEKLFVDYAKYRIKSRANAR